MARTTVVVGLSRRQQAKGQQAASERPAAPVDPIAQLKELAALKEQGILTEEEFTAQKPASWDDETREKRLTEPSGHQRTSAS